MTASGEGRLDGLKRRPRLTAAAAGLALLVGLWVGHTALDSALLRTPPDDLAKHPVLTGYAQAVAWLPYETRCAGCHGADLKGLAAHHTPDLTDRVWLFDDGEVSDIERTVAYGIRSGHGKSHNVTDMPAFLFTGRLTRADIADVAEYVIHLEGKPADAVMSARGKAIFAVKGVCYDCHSPDGAGQPDYGAPSLRTGKWMYGGDRAALQRSIAEGRHGQCPAWIDKLRPAAIRALAVKIHDASHRS